jgi:hypothetical protein
MLHAPQVKQAPRPSWDLDLAAWHLDFATTDLHEAFDSSMAINLTTEKVYFTPNL